MKRKLHRCALQGPQRIDSRDQDAAPGPFGPRCVAATGEVLGNSARLVCWYKGVGPKPRQLRVGHVLVPSLVWFVDDIQRHLQGAGDRR